MGFLWRGEDRTLRQANETLDLLVSGCCQVHKLSGTVIVQETVKHLRQKLVVLGRKLQSSGGLSKR